jgi:hypothetical protein
MSKWLLILSVGLIWAMCAALPIVLAFGFGGNALWPDMAVLGGTVLLFWPFISFAFKKICERRMCDTAPQGSKPAEDKKEPAA